MRTCLALLLAVTRFPASLAAQWSIAPEVGLAAYSGSARDSGGLRVGPTRSTTLALRVGWEGSRWGAGVRLLYGSTGIGASDGDLTVIQEHQVRLYEIAGLVSLRVTRGGAGSELRLEAGPAYDHWAPTAAANRSRIGAQAGAEWSFPVTQRLVAAVRITGTLSASMFDEGDVPPGAVRRPTWRRGVCFAVRRRL